MQRNEQRHGATGRSQHQGALLFGVALGRAEIELDPRACGGGGRLGGFAAAGSECGNAEERSAA
jgi:hypothetical protein